MRILDRRGGEGEERRGEGPSEARTRALNEILRGTEVEVGSPRSVARGRSAPLCSVEFLCPSKARCARRDDRFPQWESSKGGARWVCSANRRRRGGRGLRGSPILPPLCLWSPIIITRHEDEFLASAHAARTHHSAGSLALGRILMRNRKEKKSPLLRDLFPSFPIHSSKRRRGLPLQHSPLILIMEDKGDE